jgi:hypothetical protein
MHGETKEEAINDECVKTAFVDNYLHLKRKNVKDYSFTPST